MRSTFALLPVAIFVLIPAAAVGAAKPGSIEAASTSITQKDLKQHVGYLASDTFEGREAGTRGGKMAAVYITAKLRSLKSLKPAGDKRGFLQHFGAGYRNILAVLPGSDPTLKKQYVVVCAHYDHVGYGTRRNSQGPVGYIHNGADDNASGTAAVLEVVQAMAQLKARPRRSILFVFWDAEEKGLLGSEYWVKHPTIPLKNVGLVLNLDMVGRMKDRKVEVHGCRGAYGMRRFICEHTDCSKLKVDFTWKLPRESDHYPFLQSAIPAVMLHTGKHFDYHRPSDDAHKLNLPGLQSLSRLTLQLSLAAANADRLPRFRGACFDEDDRDRRQRFSKLAAVPARLGLSWDGDLAKKGEIRIGSVTGGGAADRAGVKVGDRLLKFGGVRVRNTGHFRRLVMRAVNPVPILIQRSGRKQLLKLSVRLAGQPRRLGISWEDDSGEPGSIVLRRVIPDSPADVAGLRVGDRVYSVDGRSFKTSREFQNAVAVDRWLLRMRIEREGTVRDVRVYPTDDPPVAAVQPR